MKKLFFTLLFVAGYSFANHVSLYIDYDGVWAPKVSNDSQQTQLCAANPDAKTKKHLADFCKLEFGTNMNNISNHNNQNIYLYDNQKSDKILAEFNPGKTSDCHYSVVLMKNGELQVTKSADQCSYKVYAKVERDDSFLKVYTQTPAMSI